MEIDSIIEVFKQSLTITSFVLVMMLLVDFFNVLGQGAWTQLIRRSAWMQILMAALLGAIPGCLGVYAVVALYSHQLLGFGALLAAMIASIGDEAFLLFSLEPRTGVQLMLILLLLSVSVGGLVQLLTKRKQALNPPPDHLEIHHGHDRGILSFQHVQATFTSFDWRKVLLLVILALVSVLIASGLGHAHHHDCDTHGSILEHHHPAWIAVVFLIASLSALLLILFFSPHFVREHVWGHIIKKHFAKIFLWIFGSLLLIYFVSEALDLELWMDANREWLYVIAILVGLLPVSGPHMVFVSFYAMGALPLSVLLVNSIVQDGHGALLLLAENKKAFLLMKGIKVLLASVFALAGLIGYW